MKSLNNIQRILFTEYQKNGYLSMWTNNYSNKNPHQGIFDIAELGLICTEVSEAIEEIRKPTNENALFLECSDIIIRTLNFMTRKGANAEYFIKMKHKENLLRGKLHGKQI